MSFVGLKSWASVMFLFSVALYGHMSLQINGQMELVKDKRPVGSNMSFKCNYYLPYVHCYSF